MKGESRLLFAICVGYRYTCVLFCTDRFVMKKLMLSLALAGGLTHAASDVCARNGKSAEHTDALNQRCTHYHSDDIKQAAASMPPSASAPAKTVPQIIEDEISQIWTGNEWRTWDDTVILRPPVADDAPALVGSQLKTIVRHPVIRNNPAPIVAVPVRPPQLTRRQVLQQELSREQSALMRAQNELAAARQRNDTAAIRRLDAQVRDRQLNVQALQQEMRR